LRIAQVAPLSLPVPPQRYGGTERVVATLTEGLSQRGHEVTLFAAGTSLTSARLHATVSRPLWEMQPEDPLAYRVLQVEELVRESRRFDVIHSHVDYLAWLAGDRIAAPMVTTLHGRLDVPELRPLLQAFRHQPLVSISAGQRRPVKDLPLNWVGTVHHGFPLGESYRLGPGDGGYLVFLGRVSPEKGTAAAIRIAIRAGLPLKLAARIDRSDRPYFENEVRPFLEHPLIQWIGEQDDRGKNELLGAALALLAPIEWDEPFGITIVEALAAGTPVISRPRGSLPELVRHGEHGFLVETEDEMVAALSQLEFIDRRRCREWAVRQFSVEQMVDGYERVYHAVLARARARAQQPAVPTPTRPEVTLAVEA
jgi:glycosyltransferase involved in cell wall biosynthesis